MQQVLIAKHDYNKAQNVFALTAAVHPFEVAHPQEMFSLLKCLFQRETNVHAVALIYRNRMNEESYTIKQWIALFGSEFNWTNEQYVRNILNQQKSHKGGKTYYPPVLPAPWKARKQFPSRPRSPWIIFREHSEPSVKPSKKSFKPARVPASEPAIEELTLDYLSYELNPLSGEVSRSKTFMEDEHFAKECIEFLQMYWQKSALKAAENLAADRHYVYPYSKWEDVFDNKFEMPSRVPPALKEFSNFIRNLQYSYQFSVLHKLSVRIETQFNVDGSWTMKLIHPDDQPLLKDAIEFDQRFANWLASWSKVIKGNIKSIKRTANLSPNVNEERWDIECLYCANRFRPRNKLSRFCQRCATKAEKWYRRNISSRKSKRLIGKLLSARLPDISQS